MKIRLGYVAMVMSLEDCSPSGTVTVSRLKALPADQARWSLVSRTARKNLANTLRILRYNLALGIQVYRLTSKLIPLATYPDLAEWEYEREFEPEFREIGDFIKQNHFRVSAHPDHFTLLNSPSEKVWEDSLRDLDYHERVYRAMGLEESKYKLVLHVGGIYGDKAASVARFKQNFLRLPEPIRNRIILENDDKSYTAGDVLELCNELDIPMVLDIHHHDCRNDGERLEALLPQVFSTWRNEPEVPKIHFSSPQSEKAFRNHAEYIDFERFCRFLRTAAEANRDVDVMLEAKAKNLALEKLAEKLETLDWVRKAQGMEFEIF